MTAICSGSEVLTLYPHAGILIGERINPTGKKRLKEAYLQGDVAYVMREAVAQVAAGARALDVNCGVPGVDEAALLCQTIEAVESVVACPLQIDTADAHALEMALRRVNGKALVNSVNGKVASMDAVFPIVRKYGGVMVGLCLDEGGIPATPEGRLAIAQHILDEGARHGFTREDFVFDALTLAVSADPQAAQVTLETIHLLTEKLGVNTVLGVSNISFGLPNRPALNNAMYALAKRRGLSAAIANPLVLRDETNPEAEDVLLGRDPGCARWIALHSNTPVTSVPTAVPSGITLRQAVASGLKADARDLAVRALAGGQAALSVINTGIVPALEEVGRGFEQGRVYLPQLLMAADAASAAFEAVRSELVQTQLANAPQRCRVVLATVKGDIHDIGKNIVRALLESYGFPVIDLGRDVAPERIVQATADSQAQLVGLSALMTTTVGAMAETIRQIKAAKLNCRVCVGGAVVTQEYADSIGADYYAKDAMRTVRIAESLSQDA